MAPSDSNDNMTFDYHTIRLLIGLIAVFLPLVVFIRALTVTPSISWSYWTQARDLFVGFLFVIGGFFFSYKGHLTTLDESEVGKFWKSLGGWAVNFRIWERKYEEQIVSTLGGIAAGVTATNPTAFCYRGVCPPDPIANIHYVGAFILFSATVYFCLVAFTNQVKSKIRATELAGEGSLGPKKLRIGLYRFCGWGIVAVMLALYIAGQTGFGAVDNLTYYAETAALVLFGIAWLVASQYLPVVTDKDERKKFFFEPRASGASTKRR